MAVNNQELFFHSSTLPSPPQVAAKYNKPMSEIEITLNGLQVSAGRMQLGAKMGMATTKITAAETVATMPVEGNRQSMGLLHGGATAALCETVGSIAAAAHAQTVGEESGQTLVAVGTEVSISHLRSTQGGTVTATATALHLGRTRTVHQVRVKDDEDRLVSFATVTNMIIAPR